MFDIKISYYATNWEVPDYLNVLLKPWGYELIEYQIGDIINNEMLLLISPVWINEHFISCDQNWKKYLQKENPDIKLITVGNLDTVQHNYIDILKPPKDFHFFFNQAKSVNEIWAPVNTRGLDMEAKLHRFFEGHGYDSIRQIFSPIHRRLNIISDTLDKGTPYHEIWVDLIMPTGLSDKWRIFRNRFSNYYPFFYCLPFFTLFEKIHILVNEIDPFFQQECSNQKLLTELECVLRINEINNLLLQIEKYA